ncbi:MAG TPA: 4-hydroxy-2-oxovalerate aldolase [Firmicutes bacterium]|nr:4-hydroxy-2-oxovalerate aldolase [Bacillota bacterium]
MAVVNGGRLKQIMASGRAVLGGTVSVPCPATAEVLGYCGFDFLFVDMEHTSIGTRDLEEICRAAEPTGAVTIARLPDSNQSTILKNLDVGPGGIQVPHVESREEVQDIVRSARYYPVGMRGMSAPRSSRYGLDLPDYYRWANDETLLVVMIESKEAVAKADEICSVPGIDVVFVGTSDLSQSLGIPGQTNHRMVHDALDVVLAACRKAGIFAGTVARNAQEARELTDRGFRYLQLPSDMRFILDAGRAMVREIRGA